MLLEDSPQLRGALRYALFGKGGSFDVRRFIKARHFPSSLAKPQGAPNRRQEMAAAMWGFFASNAQPGTWPIALTALRILDDRRHHSVIEQGSNSAAHPPSPALCVPHS